MERSERGFARGFRQELVINKTTHLDTEKQDSEMMILVIVLVRNVNYGRRKIRKKTEKVKYLEAKKKAKRAVYQAKCMMYE